MRTEIEKAAGELDIDMHRLVGRMERFADSVSLPKSRASILAAAQALFFARSEVRAYMNRVDWEATKLSDPRGPASRLSR